jgi:pimeloyl-ACP methyl ester carboxylesterase
VRNDSTRCGDKRCHTTLSTPISSCSTPTQVKGPPVLLLRGWTCDGNDWAWLSSDLEVVHRVIVADHRGHGRSSIVDGPYGAIPMAHDAATLLSELQLTSAVMVGHSMGTLVASALTVEHPARVRALVLVDPVYGVPDEPFRSSPLSVRTPWKSRRPASQASTLTRARHGCPPGIAVGSKEHWRRGRPKLPRPSTKDPTASDGHRSEPPTCLAGGVRSSPSTPARVQRADWDRHAPWLTRSHRRLA